MFTPMILASAIQNTAAVRSMGFRGVRAEVG